MKSHMVNKHVKESRDPIKSDLNTGNMPHASTGYLGACDSGGLKTVFQLDELVGDDSAYSFELRRDGR